ncbi:MAG: protein kinase domain-containing protein [Deltaproteobacteria bacterium]
MPVLTESERVGTTVGGKYRLDRIIGRGGVGTVFAGVHAWTGREVAVKMLHVQYAEDRAVVDRFLVEARASATLRHPNVVDVLDMGKDDDGAVYMVLEYLEGESLSLRLERRRRLSPEETAAILLPVMDALAEAHDVGIVHRDIKPENVFIAVDGKRRAVPKLLDFGIAKVLAAGSARATRTGTVVGTPAYMSPEQADGRSEVGPASDVWSMGVLLYECLTGGLPFPSDSPTATLVAILTTTPSPLRTVLPAVPAPLAHAVDRALSRAPADRWTDMRAFSAAILTAVGPAALQRPEPSSTFQPIDSGHDRVVASPTPARAVAATEAMAVARVPEAPTRALLPTLHMGTPALSPASVAEGSRVPSSSLMPTRAWLLAALGTLLLIGAVALSFALGSAPASPPVVVTQPPTASPVATAPVPPVPSALPGGMEPPTSPPPTPEAAQVPTMPTPRMEPPGGQAVREPDSAALRDPLPHAEPRHVLAEALPETAVAARPFADPISEEGPIDSPQTEPSSQGGSAAVESSHPRPTRSEVIAAMGAVMPSVRACADGQDGRATTRVNVVVEGATGLVSSAQVEGALSGTPAGSCVVRAVRGASFPLFSDPTFTFTYPLALGDRPASPPPPSSHPPSRPPNDSIIID